jgi:chemotaxis protein histidine kinase CheA
MWNEFCGPVETTEVRVVESCGMAVALPENSVVGVVPLVGDPAHMFASGNGVATMYMDDRFRPLISLRQALCIETPAGHVSEEDVVVVVRIGGQLFGLQVEHARTPEPAMVLPTVTAAPPLAVFRGLLQMADGGILFTLNPSWLAVTIGSPVPADGPRVAPELLMAA